MAIAKRILDLHHSAVAVHSDLGKTTIAFTLSYAHAAAAALQSSADSFPQTALSALPRIDTATALPQRAG